MSQLDAETKTIDGDTYKVLKLDPLTANDILLDLVQAAAPTLGALGGGLLSKKDSSKVIQEFLDGVEGSGAEEKSAVMERAITASLDRVSKQKFREIVTSLASVTSVQSGSDWPELSKVFPIHFRGRIGAMYKWIGFALGVQYKDFFTSVPSVIARAGQLLQNS